MTWFEWVGLVSAAVTVVGFAVTISQLFATKSVAVRAERAAVAARDEVRRFDLVVDFSSLIAVLEEVRRLQRDGVWAALPERYSQARRLLISARHVARELTEDQKERIQLTIVNFRDMELLIENAAGDGEKIPKEEMNKRLLEDIDEIIAIFQILRMASKE